MSVRRYQSLGRDLSLVCCVPLRRQDFGRLGRLQRHSDVINEGTSWPIRLLGYATAAQSQHVLGVRQRVPAYRLVNEILTSIRCDEKQVGERPKSALYLRFKILKGGTPWGFLTSIVLQNIETNEGENLWCNPKHFKKSRTVPKKIRVKNTKGGSLVCFLFSRFWTSMFLFWTRFWRFEYILDICSSSWRC